jgi:hypothetical protein
MERAAGQVPSTKASDQALEDRLEQMFIAPHNDLPRMGTPEYTAFVTAYRKGYWLGAKEYVVKRNAAAGEVSSTETSGEGTSEEAKKILCLILDSWILGEESEAFEKQHPDISDVVFRSHKLLRYDITASKTVKDFTDLNADKTGQKRNKYTFAVTLVFITEGGQESKQAKKYALCRFDGKWYCAGTG